MKGIIIIKSFHAFLKTSGQNTFELQNASQFFPIAFFHLIHLFLSTLVNHYFPRKNHLTGARSDGSRRAGFQRRLPPCAGAQRSPAWRGFSGNLQEQIQNYQERLRRGRSTSQADTPTENTVISPSFYSRKTKT